MLDILEQVETELPKLLTSDEGWQSLNINYHPPFVERVVRSWGDFRISLHRIFPCESSEALFHPHPWPSAMHILSGVYEMAVGYGPGDQPPPHAAKLIVSGDMKYEMTHPDAWHYVRPIDEPAMTLMITGQPWERWSPGSDKLFSPLAPKVQEEIMDFFRDRFC